jgi:magnesium-transporting ATPase (P-type)
VENEYGSGMNALRCLAHAYAADVNPNDPRLADPKKFEQIESGLTFAGLVGILDPPRVEVKPAIETCRKAGIRVIVITGDNQKTAETVCRKIGVFKEVNSKLLIVLLLRTHLCMLTLHQHVSQICTPLGRTFAETHNVHAPV